MNALTIVDLSQYMSCNGYDRKLWEPSEGKWHSAVGIVKIACFDYCLLPEVWLSLVSLFV